jgi:hypothetical protein
MLAHAGEELLIPLAIVAVVLLVVPAIRRRARRSFGDDGVTPAEGSPRTCPYCGADLEPAVARCPVCGFRV